MTTTCVRGSRVLAVKREAHHSIRVAQAIGDAARDLEQAALAVITALDTYRAELNAVRTAAAEVGITDEDWSRLGNRDPEASRAG